MRILLIAPMLPQAEAAGAIPMLLHAQLEGLRARHEVTLLAGIGDEPGEERAARDLIRDEVDLCLVDRRVPSMAGRRCERRLRLTRSWVRGRRPWRTVWFAAPSAQAAINRLSAARRFDVVAVEDSSMAVFRLPAEVPAVLTEHEIKRSEELARPRDGARDWPRWLLWELDRRRWTTFQPAAWRRFDLLQVFTDREAQAVGDMAPDVAARVRVNPFGLVLPAIADPSCEQPGVVLFVGNFTHPPNRDAVVWLAREIMPAVRLRYPSARLRIVGGDPPREVVDLAAPWIDVVGSAPSVQPHLEHASVVAAPVRIGGGMRLKVLHAMASGKAVVTTQRGADGYTARGRLPPLVVADDTEGLAAAIAMLLHDEATRRQLGTRGRAFAAEHHSPAAWASRLERVYEEAHDQRPQRPTA